jgi:hypothetical protein
MNNSDHQLEQARAMRTVKAQLQFISRYETQLSRIDKGGKMMEAYSSFKNLTDRGETLTPNQMSYVDGIYEKVFKALGLPSISVKQEKRHPAKLRF